MRNTRLEVDINKFYKNIKNIQKYVGNKKLMPVIKANAYGTYINRRIDVINNFDIVAVAIIDEAIELRELGYNKEIFVLNQPSIDDIANILKYNITIGLSDKIFLGNLKYNITIGLSDKIFLGNLKYIQKPIKIHLEIETGMNRTGINLKDLDGFIDKIKANKNIIVEGIYTHLSSADYDNEYTELQLEKFRESVTIIKNKINTIKYIHSSASNGLINYNDNISNLVRPGIIMYGYKSFNKINEKLDLYPICKLKTQVTFIKDIEVGESISYSRNYITKNKMRIATIPIGYADGLRRELSNKGEVIINNKTAKIVGNICMDSCMIDVTNIEKVNIGTDVYIWDNKNITLESIAEKCNTINYEILSTISYRVPREFIFENK